MDSRPVGAAFASSAEAGSPGDRARRTGLACAALLLLRALPPRLADNGILEFGGGVEVLAALPAATWLIWLSLTISRTTLKAASGEYPPAVADPGAAPR